MQPAPVPEWQKEDDDRKKITLDQLMRMSSGLEFEEIYAPLFDVNTKRPGAAFYPEPQKNQSERAAIFKFKYCT